MSVNSDRPASWKPDIAASVDQYNAWFMEYAPMTFRAERKRVIVQVREMMTATNDFRSISRSVVLENPKIVQALRMSTAPPIARDRLSGLSYTTKSIVAGLEEGKLPIARNSASFDAALYSILEVLNKLLDRDIFEWLTTSTTPSRPQRERAATIVADRLCGATTDPLIRNEQERRQLRNIEQYLVSRGYNKADAGPKTLKEMKPGTYAFRMNVLAGDRNRPTRIPVDVVVQPKKPTASRLPILMEAKSAGDYTNVNKRRKEEAQKLHQLRQMHGKNAQLILFLCGYFDTGYLGYSAAEGLDWVWEHRISDLKKFGI
jgi:hypothetical protein